MALRLCPPKLSLFPSASELCSPVSGRIRNEDISPYTLHFSPTNNLKCLQITRATSSAEFPPNALRRKADPHWRGGFSLGVDLGLSRTGLALSKGFCFRPLTVIFNWARMMGVIVCVYISSMWLYDFGEMGFSRFWNCEDKSLKLNFLKLRNRRYQNLFILLLFVSQLCVWSCEWRY